MKNAERSYLKNTLAIILLLRLGMVCQANEPIEIKALKNIFDKYNVAGSILIYDLNNKEYKGYNLDRCNMGFSPASTFKIPNTLIALETGTITTDSIFHWAGEKRSYPKWEADMNISQAFKVSNVPVYQNIARSIGLEKMKYYVRLLHFGEMDITDENLDKFWLEDDSKISQYQQIYFLCKLYNSDFPLQNETMESVKQIMVFKNGR